MNPLIDVGMVKITSPPEIVFVDTSYIPQALIQNCGPDTAGLIPVVCVIDTNDHRIYIDTTEIITLAAGDTCTVDFSDWTVPTAEVSYMVAVWTLYTGDPYASNDTIAKDIYSVIPGSFIRGDVDGSGGISMSDGIRCFRCQFVPGWQDSCKCDDATDADDNGMVSIGNCLRILRKQFVPGWQDSIPPPCCSAPNDCGPDPTDDEIGCDEYIPCGTEESGEIVPEQKIIDGQHIQRRQ